MVRLDVGARDILRAFARRHHVTQAQLLSAIVRRFPDEGQRIPQWLADAIAEAHDVDDEMRQRG